MRAAVFAPHSPRHPAARQTSALPLTEAVSMTPDEPIMCSLEPDALRSRRDALLPSLIAHAERVEEIDAGYRIRFADATRLRSIASVIDAERQCCRFLEFRLTVEAGGGAMWLELTGPSGAKEFLADLLTRRRV